MKYIETLKASTYNQAQAFFFSEMQKALDTKAEHLLQWLGFDPVLLDLTTDETVYLYRLELPTFELISFAEQLEFAYSAAADITQQYVGIFVNVAHDEDSGLIVVYLASEDVAMSAIETLFTVEDEEPRRTASVHPLSLVPNADNAPAPVEQPIAPSEPVAPANGGPQGFHATGPVELAPEVEEDDEEPETFEAEDTGLNATGDVVQDEPFNEDMLTVEQLENLDVLRKDEEAVAFIRVKLETGVEQFDSFVEFNDVSDFPMSVVNRVLELYEEFKAPPAKTEVEQIFSEDEPDTFFAEEEPDAFPTEDEVAAPTVEIETPVETVVTEEPARVAPMGGERAPDAAIAEAAVSEADEHAERFAQILQEIAAKLPNDTASEITDGALVILMSRVVPNDNGVGMRDVDYNLRLTIRREMFANVKEIDKYRLENNGEVELETGSMQTVIDHLNNL
jgi:hypothetical protein